MKHFKIQLVIALLSLPFLINATRDGCKSSVSFYIGMVLILGVVAYILIVEHTKHKDMNITWILIEPEQYPGEKYMLTGREYVLLPEYKKSLYKIFE